MMQPKCRAGGVYCSSQEPQASGREWRLRFHKRHGFLQQTCRTNLLSAVPHSFRRWAAERLTARFRPTVAKNSISTLLHCCVAFVTWKHGADIEKCHNKSLWRPQTKKSNQDFTVTGMSMSCLDRARTPNLGTENLRRQII